MYLLHIYVYSVSSPYLLIFGNDRVRGTRDQMMLQVDLVRRRVEVGLAWKFLFRVFFMLCFEMICNPLYYHA